MTPKSDRRFKVGDVVRFASGAWSGEKGSDLGQLATIADWGSVFDWRINMNNRDRRVWGDYDWGVNEEHLELADGPW